MSQAAGERAEALLEVLDEFARPRVSEAAFDEIFVGRQPVLMGVEPQSFCWVLGQLAENRTAQTWSHELQKFTALEHAVTDAGAGLMKGLTLAHDGRAQPLSHCLDVFHTLREGGRAWRITQARVYQQNEQAQQRRQQLEQRRRRCQPLHGYSSAVSRLQREADEALESAVDIETAWQHVRACLELFTPQGELNTAAAARAELEQWLPRLTGSAWAKTVRLLRRPQSLAFLTRLEQKLGELPLDGELKQEALRYEGLARRPSLLAGEDAATRARRGWWLLANLRYTRDGAFRQAVESVREVLRRAWRASSLVEGIHSVVRMQQARHRRLTPRLIALKRFYWNCRPFRTGRRRKQSPYELLGLRLPNPHWWKLLHLTPQQLRQQLSTQTLTA